MIYEEEEFCEACGKEWYRCLCHLLTYPETTPEEIRQIMEELNELET